MRKIVCILSILALILSSCKPVEVVHDHYHNHFERDSVFFNTKDSVFFWQIGDTVRIKEVHHYTECRYVTQYDTLRTCDTLTIVKNAAKVGKCQKKCGGWFAAGLLIGIFVIFATILLTKKIKS